MRSRKRGTTQAPTLPLVLAQYADDSSGRCSIRFAITFHALGRVRQLHQGVPTPSITSQEYALEQSAQSQPEHEPEVVS